MLSLKGLMKQGVHEGINEALCLYVYTHIHCPFLYVYMYLNVHVFITHISLLQYVRGHLVRLRLKKIRSKEIIVAYYRRYHLRAYMLQLVELFR